MLSAIGLIIAIALLIVMIVKGVDMITASVVTAAIILVTSGLDFWEGLLKTFSEGAGSFCTSWFLILALGGIGVISVIANIAPQQTHDMCASYMAGDREKALELQMKSLPLVDALFSEVNPIPVKRALNLLGMEVGSLRAPLCEMSDANAAVLKQAMVEYGLL